MGWSRGAHARKYLRVNGWYLDGGGQILAGELDLRAEWEPQSEVLERLTVPDGRHPHVLHRPYGTELPDIGAPAEHRPQQMSDRRRILQPVSNTEEGLNSMASVRVYELARELGVDSSDLVRELASLGRPVKSASSPIAPEDVMRLRSTRTRTTSTGTPRHSRDSQNGKCPCCFRDDLELVPPKMPNGLPADRDTYICEPCARHSQPGNQKEVQRNRSHVLLYSQDAQIEVNARRNSFDEELAHLRKELADRPVVERSLDQAVLAQAKSQTHSALRSRDHAYAELLTIKLLHRQQPGTKCSCGRRDSCPTARRFSEPESGLNSWEADQVERLRRNEPHHLPANHPAVLDPRRANGWG